MAKNKAKTTSAKANTAKAETSAKAETKAEEVKEEVVETVVAETPVTEETPVANEEKTAPKTEEKPAEKKTAKTTSTKKTTTKSAEKKTEPKEELDVVLQFAGKEEIFHKDLVKKAKEDAKARFNLKSATKVALYVKPEENKVYYVVNGYTGDFNLFD